MLFTKASYEKKLASVSNSKVLQGSINGARKKIKKDGYYNFINGHLTTQQYYSIKKRFKNNLKVNFENEAVENEFYAICSLNVALRNAGLKGYVLQIIDNTEKYTDFKFKFSAQNEKGEYIAYIAAARYSIDINGEEKIEEIKKK